MNKQIKVLSLGIAFLTLTSAVFAVDRWVPSQYSTIQAAIDDSNNGDMVIIEPNTYTGPGNRDIDFKGLAITVRSTDPNDPNIVAATVIDCENQGRGFYLHSGEDTNSVIAGLTITNGYADAGGGIYLENSGATISRCLIIANAAKDGEPGGDGGSGGGIYCDASTVAIKHCTIADNTAGTGGAYNENFLFPGNGGSGGSIYCGDSSTLLICDCNISGNKTGNGGYGGKGGSGGAIDCNFSTVTIKNCTINNNRTGNAGYPPWEFVADIDAGNGGGICCRNSSSLLICDSNITNNKTGSGNDSLRDGGDGGSGAGVYCDQSSSLEVLDCLISGNITGRGGPGYPVGGLSGRGAGIYCLSSHPLHIVDCTIANNTMLTGASGISGHGNEGGYGGGVYCKSAIIENCVLHDNAAGEGGDSYNYGYRGGCGGAIYCTYSLILTDCTITGNTAGHGGNPTHGNDYGNGGDGGGVYCLGCSLVEIEDCNISGNSAGHRGRGGNGGGVYCESCSTVTIETSIFKDNSAGNADGGVEEGGQGGGIWCSSASVSNCVIIGNTSGDGSSDPSGGDDIGTNAGDGGGIYCGSVTISNCLIVDNSTGDGGAALWEGGDGGDGAGIFCSTGSSAVATSCTIAGNITGAGGDSGFTPGANGIGGGLYADSNTVISDSIIWGNSPEQLFGHDCNKVSFCDIADNTCSSGIGNISIDPYFADPGNGDYHLKSQVGRWDTVSCSWVQDGVTSSCIDAGDPISDWTAELWPHGKRINMGAYGGTPEASMSLSNVGNIADLNHDDKVNFNDFDSFATGFPAIWLGCQKSIPHGSVIVDGDLNEWAGAKWIPLDKVYYGYPNDINIAKFALCWNKDTNKIYAAVIVDDTDHVFRDDYGNWDASDRIEVYSQGDAAGGSGWSGVYDVAQQYMVAPDTMGGCWATWGLGQTIEPEAGFEYAVIDYGGPLIYEVGVQMFDNYGARSGGETVITNLSTGHIVRFDVLANTRWGQEGFGMLSENTMTGKHKNADNIAIYTLVEQPGEQCILLAADLDRNGVLNFVDLAIFVDNWLWVAGL